MARVVITEFMDVSAVERLQDRFETVYDPGLVKDTSRLKSLLSDCEVLVVRNQTQVRDDLLDAGPSLKMVGRLGVGLDNIDLEACKTRNVTVKPATGANADAVAEYVIATAMMMTRGQAYQVTQAIVQGLWPRTSCQGGEVAGRTLGLLGYGDIARRVARRAQALGMIVVGHDPYFTADHPVWGDTRSVSLDYLMTHADIVSLHVPLVDSTRHLLNADRLASMKSGGMIINTSRGGIIDETALVDLLTSGHLGGAALDVFEVEPVSADTGKHFADRPNLLLTPHIAGVTAEANGRVSAMIADAVIEVLS